MLYEKHTPDDHRRPFRGIVRPVKTRDLLELELILREWIIDPNTKKIDLIEVQKMIDSIGLSAKQKNQNKYLVAEEDGRVIGMVGFKPIEDDKLRSFAETDNPVELINSYVLKTERGGRGVGTKLFNHIFELAKQSGFTEALGVSGPRYRDSGWDFHTKNLGAPIGVIKNMYGHGIDASVWRKVF